MVGVARGHQRADTLKPYSQKTSQSNHTRTTAWSNSMNPSHACGATQDGRVMVERSDRMWSTGEGNRRNQPAWLQAPLQSHSHQDSMVLAQRQKYRSVEQNRKPRDKCTHLWTPYLWQRATHFSIAYHHSKVESADNNTKETMIQTRAQEKRKTSE